MDSNQSNHRYTLPFSHKKKMRLNRPKMFTNESMYQDEINSLWTEEKVEFIPSRSFKGNIIYLEFT